MVKLPGYFYSPIWSPDGTKIAFSGSVVTLPSAGSSLYAINLDGTGLTNLTPSRNAGSCDWQPLATETPFSPGPLPTGVSPPFFRTLVWFGQTA